MSVELLYTSAPQGLKQGSRGFSTVLCTVGLPANLASRLESLSGYRHVFPPNHPQAASNPVCYSHLRFTVGGKQISILSRISDYGIDYSQRTNKLAHHVVLDLSEHPPAGPAWLLSQSQLMRSDWDGACKTLASGPVIPQADQPTRICENWQRVTGDAGWGGVVAEAFASSSNKPLWIVYKLEQSSQLLTLINEAIALLPSHDRWRATFSTYATNLPPEADCKVRCVLEGTEEARAVVAKGAVVSLVAVPVQRPVGSLVQRARTGLLPTESPIVTQDSLLPDRAQYQQMDESSPDALELQFDTRPPVLRKSSNLIEQVPVVRNPDKVVQSNSGEPGGKLNLAIYVATACATLAVLAALIVVAYTVANRNLTVAILNEDRGTSPSSQRTDESPAKPIIIDRINRQQEVHPPAPPVTGNDNSSTEIAKGGAATSPKNEGISTKQGATSDAAEAGAGTESNGSTVNQVEGKPIEPGELKPSNVAVAPEASVSPAPKPEDTKVYIAVVSEEHLLRGRVEGICELHLAKNVSGVTVAVAGTEEPGNPSKNGGPVTLIKAWKMDSDKVLKINISYPGDGKGAKADTKESLLAASDYVARLQSARHDFLEALGNLKQFQFKHTKGKLPAATDITLDWLASFPSEAFFVDYKNALSNAAAKAANQKVDPPQQFVTASEIMHDFEKRAKDFSDAAFELEGLRLDNLIEVKTFIAAPPPKSGSVQDATINLSLQFKINRK